MHIQCCFLPWYLDKLVKKETLDTNRSVIQLINLMKGMKFQSD